MQTEWVFQNSQTTKPLKLMVNVETNTPQEKIFSNVLKNSRKIKQWIKQEEPNNHIAVLCGSGPSLADTVEDIRSWRMKGAHIFAMNGATRYLHEQGIIPDYQIIMDAQPQSIELIGPAKQYLFASQVDPILFQKVPDAILWQASHGEIMPDEQKGFPEHPEGYTIIGGGASVGNTSLILLYAMGYRNMQIYGMDSSHREGKGHVVHQAINDGDPCSYAEFNGKQYLCSLTMKLQAENFMPRARALKEGGCSIHVHGTGLLPDMFNAFNVYMPEVEKYERMYNLPAYRKFSPGEQLVDRFIEKVNPIGRVIDFGCGTGRAGLRMKWAGLDPLLIDFTDNSRDLEAYVLPFRQHDLTKPLPEKANYGFCTDVMEHIPPSDVEKVITNIMESAKTVFFQICTAKDSMGDLIGQELHLTVENHDWWKTMFRTLGYSVTWEGRVDEQHESLFVVTQNINHLMES